MRKITEARKAKERRGTGEGAEYIPYVFTREINSKGTCYNPVDWKHGRQMQFLSQGELYAYYIMRWNDKVVDIREQFPLELEKTLEIADYYNIKHPKDRITRMTTDMLVFYQDGTCEAISVKVSKKELDNVRVVEKLTIEKKYWESFGISFKMVFKEENINRILANNIRLVTDFYSLSMVYDKVSLIKHMIANKYIKVDMESKIINFLDLVEQYIGENEIKLLEKLKQQYISKDNFL